MKIQQVSVHDPALLWLINRVVFHPRGYSLSWGDDGELYLMGDGDGTIQYNTDESIHSAAIRKLMP